MHSFSHWLKPYWGFLGAGSRLPIKIEMQTSTGPAFQIRQGCQGRPALGCREMCAVEEVCAALEATLHILDVGAVAHQTGFQKKATAKLDLQPWQRGRGCKEPSNRVPDL